MDPLLTGAALAFLVGYLAVNARERRHQAIRSRPFPPEWETYLVKNVRQYSLLPPHLKEELRGHVMIFLAEKTFEGCGGLEVTEEMKVTVAGMACLLVLNRSSSLFKNVHTVLLYPGAFLVKGVDDGLTVSVSPEDHLGEAWEHGTVVLSWEDVLSSALVLHEFAHQLDNEGIALLPHWAEVFAREFEQLKSGSPVLDDYGATNPAEFFAVATEAFFENPERLKEAHPALYGVLSEYYQVDPAAWKA